ncbi:hypothetical protein [Paractinoplanes rishiriensis]|uniref:Uncharacterized protein n=1 Tax=Paractinoplanes rishiriensis TaxID=1050105 RepID=A0A919K9S2_9ACTN|nr:hypothetical protein [Actinoplanes rishiriensis]GIF01338.1 hypothetical protein Ari01nite_88020 [Actinoplanes rishiriensis]
MSSATTGTSHRDTAIDVQPRRRSAETKAAFKTTEFIAYVVIVLGVLIASIVVDGNGNGDNGAAGDYFRADRAWFYIVLLTIGYLVSRGLAKSGSRDSSDA